LRLKAEFNTRFVNISKGETYKDRVGVYLSWCLPLIYRKGSTASSLLNNNAAIYEYEKNLLKGGFISHIGEDDELETGKMKVSFF
jgi:hypothetical protein